MAQCHYFQNNDDPRLKSPPEGFNGVLTRAEWKGVVEFAKAVNAEILLRSPRARELVTRMASGLLYKRNPGLTTQNRSAVT